MKGIVTKSRFEQISLITPPLESQRRFSARQLTVNQLVALERKALDGLETLFTSLQHRAFQGTL
jgi:type I restriction enzyme S subunit